MVDVGDGPSVLRVSAGPFEDIDITEQGVVIDGFVQQEDDIYEKTLLPLDTSVQMPVRLTGDEYFVLGDGRGHARDSRAFGPVSSRQIQGRAIALFRLRGL